MMLIIAECGRMYSNVLIQIHFVRKSTYVGTDRSVTSDAATYWLLQFCDYYQLSSCIS